MAQIKINNVTFLTTPLGIITCTVRHRLTSAPDVLGSYTIDTTSLLVNPDGSLFAPFYINGLTAGVSYRVQIIPNCGGAAVQGDVTPGAPAPTTTAAAMLNRVYTPGLFPGDVVGIELNGVGPSQIVDQNLSDVEFSGPVPVNTVTLTNLGGTDAWYYEIFRRSNDSLIATGPGTLTSIIVSIPGGENAVTIRLSTEL